MISTWSAKIEDEQKEKLQYLIDQSGLSSKDFLENLILTYELNESKVHVKEISEDISEVQQMTQRMTNIFINVAERIESIKAFAEADKIRALEERQNIISALTEKVSSLAERVKVTEEEKKQAIQDHDKMLSEMGNLKITYEKEVTQFTEANRNSQQLITEYKEKIDNLSSLVAEFQDKAKQNSELTLQLAKYENELKETKRDLDKFKGIDNENQDLKNKVVECENELKEKSNEINNLQRNFESEKERMEIDTERKIIQAEKAFNDSLQRVQEDYNKKIFELIGKINKKNASTGTKKITK